MSFNYLTIRSCFLVAGISIFICHLHKLITMVPPICWLLSLVHTQEMSQILVLFILFLPTWACFSAFLYSQAKPKGLIGGVLRCCSNLWGVYVHREFCFFVGVGGLFFPLAVESLSEVWLVLKEKRKRLSQMVVSSYARPISWRRKTKQKVRPK